MELMKEMGRMTDVQRVMAEMETSDEEQRAPQPKRKVRINDFGP